MFSFVFFICSLNEEYKWWCRIDLRCRNEASLDYSGRRWALWIDSIQSIMLNNNPEPNSINIPWKAHLNLHNPHKRFYCKVDSKTWVKEHNEEQFTFPLWLPNGNSWISIKFHCNLKIFFSLAFRLDDHPEFHLAQHLRLFSLENVLVWFWFFFVFQFFKNLISYKNKVHSWRKLLKLHCDVTFRSPFYSDFSGPHHRIFLVWYLWVI